MPKLSTAISTRRANTGRKPISPFGKIGLGQVWDSRAEEDMNVFFKVLDGLAIGQQAIAGVAIEMERRGKGLPARSMYQAALRGIADKKSFREVTPDDMVGKGIGTALDIAIDPINLLGVGPVAKVWSKGVSGVGKVAINGARKVPAMNRAVDALGEKFVAQYALRRYGFEDYMVLTDEALEEINGVAVSVANSEKAQKIIASQKKMLEVVPEVERRRHVYRLYSSAIADDAVIADPQTREGVRSLLEGRDIWSMNDRQFADIFGPPMRRLSPEELSIGRSGFDNAYQIVDEDPRVLEAIHQALGGRNLDDLTDREFLEAFGAVSRKSPDDIAFSRQEIREILNRERFQAQRAGEFQPQYVPDDFPDDVPVFTRKEIEKFVRNEERMVEWEEAYGLLSKEEKDLFDMFVETYDGDLFELKKELGWLDDARAAGLKEKLGAKYYAPLRWAAGGLDDGLVDDFLDVAQTERERVLRAMKGPGSSKKAAARLATLDEHIDVMEGIKRNRGMSQADYRRMEDVLRESATDPQFMKQRTMRQRVMDMDEVMQNQLELDGAKILNTELGETFNAAAADKFLKKANSFLREQGLIVPEEFVGMPKAQLREAMETLGYKFDERIVSSKLVKAQHSALKGYYVPKAIHDDMVRAMNFYQDPTPVLKGFRKLTGIYKAWTLGLFPSYHVRNVVSGLWNNSLAGMHPLMNMHHYSRAIELQNTFWKGTANGTRKLGFRAHPNMTEKELYEQMMRHNVIDGGQFSEISGIMSDVTPSKIAKLYEPGVAPHLKAGYQAGRAVDNNLRMAHVLWRLSKGDTMANAVKSMKKFQFDYRYGITPWEKTYLRDSYAPFWTWTRFNVPLQLEMLTKKPYKYANARKLIRAHEDMYGGPDPDETFIARWIKEGASVRWRLNKETGAYEYFLLDSWWPAADVQRILPSRVGREALNMLTPILKAPAEALLFNYSLFHRRKIQTYKGQTKEIAGIPLPARLEHMARSVRLLNEIDRVTRQYQEQGGKSAFVRLFVGKAYPQDIEKQKKHWEAVTREQMRNLSSAKRAAERANRAGEVKKIERLIEELRARRKELL